MLKDREVQIEQKVQENFQMKQSIDGLKQERDKARKRVEDVEDQARQRDMEINQQAQMN